MDEKERLVWNAGFTSFEKVNRKNFKQLNNFFNLLCFAICNY